MFTACVISLKVEPIGLHTWIALAVLISVLAPMVVFASKNPVTSKDIELWCDKKGAELTGNPQAALDSLRIMLADQTAKQAKATGYPTPQARFEQMEEMCRVAEGTE